MALAKIQPILDALASDAKEYDFYNILRQFDAVVSGPVRLGRWACVLMQGGAFFGWCGVTPVVDVGEYDLGYRFFEEHWGRGFASEAAAAVLAYARRELAGKRVVGRAMVENRASVRVLEKIGLRYEGEESDEYGRLAVYVMR